MVLLAVTWRAVAEMGVAGGTVFFSDFSQPWRAQFAALCAFGGIFTLPYLFASLLRSQGDARALLLGSHA